MEDSVCVLIQLPALRLEAPTLPCFQLEGTNTDILGLSLM